MTLHVIHLANRTDRLSLLHNELVGQGISDYRIWDGIVTTDHIPKGISQAHKQIIRFAKKDNLEEVLIAEDDIKFTAKGAFRFFMTNKPLTFDIYLGGVSYGKIDHNNMVINFSGLMLYMVSNRFYETFLSLPEDIHIDRALTNRGKFIVCDPFCAIQHDGFSDSVKAYRSYESYFKNRKLFGK